MIDATWNGHPYEPPPAYRDPFAPGAAQPSLADRLRAFVVSRIEELHALYLPGFRVPDVFAGHPVGPDLRADLAFTLGLLHAGGVSQVAGHEVADALRTVLAPVSGAQIHAFSSYRVAETIARFGAFDGNRLLAALTAAEREQIAQACDSSSLAPRLQTDLPPNYCAVLARCEAARHALGLPADPSLLDALAFRTRKLMTSNPSGHLDDSPYGAGRFDIYGIDAYVITEPLAGRLGGDWTAGASAALQLVEAVATRDGTAIPWGRSTGALGACLTIELAGLAERHGLVRGQRRHEWAWRAENAFTHLRDWFSRGLITAHQYRSPYDYRGPHRRLQMTLDALGKLADAANHLGDAVTCLRPAEGRDQLVMIDESRHAGVWAYRSRELAFALPLVGGGLTDYLAVPRNPGLFEVPVGSDLVTGVPMALLGERRFAPIGLPALVTKTPDGLRVEHEGWAEAGHRDVLPSHPSLAGRRRARYRVDGETLHVEEELCFDQPPDAVCLQVAETSGRPLNVRFEAGDGDLAASIDTSGMKEYRSFWAELPVVHQVSLRPARRIAFRWAVTPLLRVLSSAHGHPYNESLYGALADRVVSGAFPPSVLAGERKPLRHWDMFHLHWPERMLPMRPDLHETIITALRESETRIVWTQHNLLPHERHGADEAVYAAWAQASDAVIHHSEWGRDRALRRYRYGQRTIHRVIPHGHFGNLASGATSVDRRGAERSLGLRHDVLRLGVIGAPRPGKRTDLAMRAVAASARDDIEMVSFSLAPGEKAVDDPRVVSFPYEMVPRAEYNRRLAVIDVLVLPYDEGDMLATGTVAEAIGLALPSLVSSWPFLTEVLGAAGIPYGRSEQDLTRCLDRLTPDVLSQASEAARRLRASRDWSRVATAHYALFREVGTAKI